MMLLELMISVAGVAFLIWSPVAFAYSASRPGRRWGAKDRLALVAGAAAAAFGLAFGRSYAPWDVIPPALFAIPAAVTVWGILAAGWAWTALPLAAARRPWPRAVATAAGVAVYVALIAVIV